MSLHEESPWELPVLIEYSLPMEEPSDKFLRWYFSRYGNRIDEFLAAFPDEEWDFRVVTKYASLKFISEHPNLNWDPTELSSRSDLTWDYIRTNDTLPFDWRLLSRHPSITFQTVMKNPTRDWSPKFLLANPNITSFHINDDLFAKVSSKGPFLSQNPNIPIDDRLLRLPGLDWYHLTMRAPLETIRKRIRGGWQISSLTMRKDLPILEIVDTVERIVAARPIPHLEYVALYLSGHPQITLSLVDELSKKGWFDWDWKALSSNVPLDDILNNPDRRWHLTTISVREDVNIKIIKSNPQVKRSVVMAILAGIVKPGEVPNSDSPCLLASPLLTWDEVKKIDGDLSSFSLNPNVTADIILSNPHVKWPTLMSSIHSITSRTNIRRLLKEERGKRVKEIFGELEKFRFLNPDVNSVIAGYTDLDLSGKVIALVDI